MPRRYPTPSRSPEPPLSGPWGDTGLWGQTDASKYFPLFFALKKGYLPQLFIFKYYLFVNEMIMTQTNNYRVRRRMPDEQRRKISEALKGKKKDPQTKKAISRGLARYWQKVEWVDDAKEGE